MDELDTGYRVRLVSVASFYNAVALGELDQVIFKVTPTLSVSGRVDYSPITPIHMPGSIQVYRNTQSREFSIRAPLISRTPDEALDNMKLLQRLQAWRNPYFGASSTLTKTQEQTRRGLMDSEQAQQKNISRAAYGVEMLGSPPDVLYLFAYSSMSQRNYTPDLAAATQQQAINIHKIPVVVASFDFTYPDDVDYIPTSDAIPSPFPVRSEVSVSLLETHSPSEYERFNLADFRRGRMVSF